MICVPYIKCRFLSCGAVWLSLSVLQLLFAANVVPSWLILFTLKMEPILYSETSDITKVTWRHRPEGGILHSRHSEILKSYLTPYSIRNFFASEFVYNEISNRNIVRASAKM
jgi:hypothetical protein